MGYEIDFSGKRALVMGIKNDGSIAWPVVLLLLEAGAEVLISWHRENSKLRIERLIAGLPQEYQKRCRIAGRCDVSVEEDIANLFLGIKKETGNLDFLVHSIAAAASLEMIQKKKFVENTQEELLKTIQVSATSLVSICREFFCLANKNASIITISFYGGQRVLPEYASLGAAKAALEAIVRQIAADFGPEKKIRANTVVAPAIWNSSSKPFPHIEEIIKYQEERSPLKLKVTSEIVAKTILFLLSDLAEGITGQTINVDAGLNILAPHF